MPHRHNRSLRFFFNGKYIIYNNNKSERSTRKGFQNKEVRQNQTISKVRQKSKINHKTNFILHNVS
jgi:hypothetical protein